MNRRCHARPLGNREGMALLLVVLVVALLVVMVVDRLQEAWLEGTLAASFRDETKAYYAARSGLTAARLILKEDKKMGSRWDSLDEEWATPSLPVPVEDEFAFVTIMDEGGKFNLNSLTSDKGYPQDRNIAYYRRLLAHLELDPGLAGAALDWIDPNDTISDGGAEEGYYLSQEPAYQPKNGKFDSVEELALVRGYTAEVMGKLRPHVTVWGSGKLNINTATPFCLLALDEEMTPNLVLAIDQVRLERPFKRKEEIKQVPGMADLFVRISLLIDVMSDTYQVVSTATFNETSKTLQGVYRRSVADVTVLYHRAL